MSQINHVQSDDEGVFIRLGVEANTAYTLQIIANNMRQDVIPNSSGLLAEMGSLHKLTADMLVDIAEAIEQGRLRIEKPSDVEATE